MLRTRGPTRAALPPQLDEAAQPLDVVEVDADVLPDEQPPPLLHHHQRAVRLVQRLLQPLRAGGRDAPVGAGAGLGGVRAPVLDQLSLAGLLLAQLETPARAWK